MTGKLPTLAFLKVANWISRADITSTINGQYLPADMMPERRHQGLSPIADRFQGMAIVTATSMRKQGLRWFETLPLLERHRADLLDPAVAFVAVPLDRGQDSFAVREESNPREVIAGLSTPCRLIWTGVFRERVDALFDETELSAESA